jgi:hypothetical protein
MKNIVSREPLAFMDKARILAGRPGHFPAAENMQVDMEDFLPGIAVTVKDRTKAALVNFFLFCNLGPHTNDVAHKCFVIGRYIGGPRYMLLRNYQNVNGGLRINILESQGLVVLVDDLRWDFLSENLAE